MKTATMEYIYGLLVILGFVLVYFAFDAYFKTTSLITNGVKSTATVIDLIRKRDSDGNNDTFTPVFEYKRGNTTQIFESNVSSSPPTYKIGEKVQVIYNSRELDEVKIVSYWGLYRMTIIFLAIAAPLLIIGGGYFWYKAG